MPKGDATYPAMTVTEALANADEWVRGMTFHAGSEGWRVVCKVLADEVRDQRAELDEQCRLLGMGSEREARLMAQLAESQAREVRLRAYLSEHDCSHEKLSAGPCPACKLLALPSDGTALREMIEAERERVAEYVDRNLMSAREYAAAIRAGGPK